MIRWAVVFCGGVMMAAWLIISHASTGGHKATQTAAQLVSTAKPTAPNTAIPALNLTEQGELKLPKAADGHYWLDATVNGHPLTFVVDTGASTITLNKTDAQMLGVLPSDEGFTGRSSTANGTVRSAPITLSSFSLAQMSWSNLPATVVDGPMDTNLLGMSFLNSLKSFSFEGDTLVMRR